MRPITRTEALGAGLRPLTSTISPGEEHIALGIERDLDRDEIPHARVKKRDGFEIWRGKKP